MVAGKKKSKPLKCLKCAGNVTKTHHKIKCANCNEWFHKSCSGLSNAEFTTFELRKTDEKWCCIACSMIQDQSASESESDDEEPTKQTQQSCSRKSLGGTAFETIFDYPNPTNKELLKAMKSMFGELKSSITFNGNVMEQMKDSIKTLVNENRLLKKEQHMLKSRVTELEREIVYMRNPDNNRNERNKNVIIVGLNGDENASSDVKKVFESLNVNIGSDDYSVKPLPSQTNRKPVLVSFSKMEIKEQIMTLRKSIKLDVKMCRIAAEGNRRIFINQDLPKHVRELHKKAIELRGAGFKFIWCKEEQVLARRAEGDPVIRIVTSAQVDSLKTA